MKRTGFILAVLFTLSCAHQPSVAPNASQQIATKTLAERLGYARDQRLLIVHADDLGMAHSVNAATTRAFESGLVNSGSIMVPCPWFPEIANYAQQHPEADLGLHLTLTSEWTPFRWGSVLPRDQVPSLYDKDGYLYITEDVAAANIQPKEAEAEIRAQIDRARAYGIRPTHLDSHMRTLHQNAALFDVLLRVSRDTGIPAMVARDFLNEPSMAAVMRPDDIVIDHLLDIGPEVPVEGWAAFYTRLIESMQPGVNQLIVHLAYDDAEIRAATFDHPDWGAAWRQRDFDFVTSERFRELLRKNNVKLITWREIQRLMVR